MSGPSLRQRRQAMETRVLENSVDADGNYQAPRTRGERTLRQLMVAPVTDADVEQSVEIDEEVFEWQPCGPIDDEIVALQIGLPDPRDQCFACKVALGVDIPIHSNDVKKLYTLMQTARDWQNELNHAKNIHELYERTIRIPSLRRTDPSQHLPEWKLATIIDHLRNHVTSPESIIARLVQQSYTINKDIFNTMWSKNMSNPDLRRINKTKVQLWIENTKLLRNLLYTDPKKCFGFSATNTNNRIDPYGNHSTITPRNVQVNTRKRKAPEIA